jgi:hypothetical protein
MATNLILRVNDTNADQSYATNPLNFGDFDLTNDYLIWTAGDSVVKDLMTHEPTVSELNAAAAEIDPLSAVTIPLCLWYDYSHDRGGAYYTHKVMGMSENKRYAYCFSFDGATATEPRLEAWDSSSHATATNHVLGNGTPLSSMIKAVCTTLTAPGSGWAGTPIAGASNYLLLNAGNGALSTPPFGSTNDLYSNLKIVIPAAYVTPSAETFVFTVRFTWF